MPNDNVQEQSDRVDLRNVTNDSADVRAIIYDMFAYHTWSDKQITVSDFVGAALTQAMRAIICNVPPSADRSAAIRKLREARMDCNSAITHEGKY